MSGTITHDVQILASNVLRAAGRDFSAGCTCGWLAHLPSREIAESEAASHVRDMARLSRNTHVVERVRETVDAGRDGDVTVEIDPGEVGSPAAGTK